MAEITKAQLTTLALRCRTRAREILGEAVARSNADDVAGAAREIEQAKRMVERSPLDLERAARLFEVAAVLDADAARILP